MTVDLDILHRLSLRTFFFTLAIIKIQLVYRYWDDSPELPTKVPTVAHVV